MPMRIARPIPTCSSFRYRGNNNIAESVFTQMQQEPHPVPKHLIMSAGTGGTSATLGRFIRYKGYETELTVVDPDNSVFYDSYVTGDASLVSDNSSRIEGIGRPKVEHSFQPNVIDYMLQVPDAASVATMIWVAKLIGRKTGPSMGTNLWGALNRAQSMVNSGEKGSIVTLLCDSGERYLDTYHNPDWVKENIGDYQSFADQLNASFS